MALIGSKKIEKLLEEIVEKLHHHHKCHNPVHLVVTTLINKSKFIIMSLEIAANQFVVGALSLIDAVTNAPVTGTFSGTTVSSDNPAVADITTDGAGGVTVTAVAAGACNVTVTTTASFTNSLGQASTSSVSTTVPVTIDAVATADNVTLVVTFGAPQPKP